MGRNGKRRRAGERGRGFWAAMQGWEKVSMDEGNGGRRRIEEKVKNR